MEKVQQSQEAAVSNQVRSVNLRNKLSHSTYTHGVSAKRVLSALES